MIISSIHNVCLINSLSLIFLFNRNLVVCIIPSIGRLTYRSFISRGIIFICSLICMIFSSSAISCECFVLYACGRQIKLCSFLFKYLAILYDGACVLFITGLIGSSFLCVFMYTLRFGAVGFMLIRYNIYVLVCLLVYCIFELFVESVFDTCQQGPCLVVLYDSPV